jgi:hypothetical protein
MTIIEFPNIQASMSLYSSKELIPKILEKCCPSVRPQYLPELPGCAIPTTYDFFLVFSDTQLFITAFTS